MGKSLETSAARLGAMDEQNPWVRALGWSVVLVLIGLVGLLLFPTPFVPLSTLAFEDSAAKNSQDFLWFGLGAAPELAMVLDIDPRFQREVKFGESWILDLSALVKPASVLALVVGSIGIVASGVACSYQNAPEILKRPDTGRAAALLSGMLAVALLIPSVLVQGVLLLNFFYYALIGFALVVAVLVGLMIWIQMANDSQSKRSP